MENPNKRSLMVLSIVQIVMSVVFFILGMIDGFEIRYGYVSLLYTQCWLAALVNILKRTICLFPHKTS